VVEKSNSALSESELNACKNDACTTAVIPSSSMHTTDTPAIIADTIILDGETVTKNDIVSMRKKIDELSEICTVREQSLLAVRSMNDYFNFCASVHSSNRSYAHNLLEDGI
jgi:hypothetical protein